MSSLETACARLSSALAAGRFRMAARRLQWALKYNPDWHLQPRVPAGQEDGGQWLPEAVSSLLPVLQRLGPVAIARLREVARHVRPFLSRSPKRWLSDDDFPKHDEFDRQTERIGPPSWHRFGHPTIRFRSERELRDYLGPAGPGREWHHIVEKRMADNGRFPVELIHNTDNIINLPVEVHRRISAIMSSKDDGFGGDVLRKRMEPLPFGDQYNIGLNLVERVSTELGYELPRY